MTEEELKYTPGLVSIIVPTYKRSDLVVETLDSIISQSYKLIEIYVVDDGSNDDTMLVLNRWKERHIDWNCTLICLETNRGKSFAVNTALEKVKGEFVMILDSDDLLLPDALEKEVRYLQANPDVGAVCGFAYVIRDGVKTQEQLRIFKDVAEINDISSFYGDMLLKGNVVISSTALIRRSAILSIGYMDAGLRYVHDYEYWIRITRSSKLAYIDKPIIYYRVHSPGSSSRNYSGTFNEICVLLFRNRDKYKLADILRSLLKQAKYHMWLGYHDNNLMEMLRVVMLCFVWMFKLLPRKAVF